MRSRKIALLLLFFFMLMSCAQSAVFYDLQGHKVSLAKLKGKWVVVTYWADWCPICREDTAEVNDFYEQLHNSDIALYGVNRDGLTGEDLKKSVKLMGIIYPTLTEDPGIAWGLSETRVLPTTFIINPKGEVVDKIEGAVTASSLMKRFDMEK